MLLWTKDSGSTLVWQEEQCRSFVIGYKTLALLSLVNEKVQNVAGARVTLALGQTLKNLQLISGVLIKVILIVKFTRQFSEKICIGL